VSNDPDVVKAYLGEPHATREGRPA
jgi:hypothetical protein